MFDEYFTPSSIDVSPVQEAAAPRAAVLVDSPVSTSIDQDAPSSSTPSTLEQSLKTSQGSVPGQNGVRAMTEPSWIDAMQEEIHEFERLQVCKLVPYQDKVLLIKLKWIYKVKTDEFGGVLKNKARLVAQGFRQEGGIDFKDHLLRLLNEAIAQRRGLRFSTRGFVDQDNPSHVYKLKKALYGLKQAPRAWYDMLSSFLISQHFSKGVVDPTLFKRQAGNDLLLMSFFLGLQISQSPRGIFINQSKYASEIVKKYGMLASDSVDTPMLQIMVFKFNKIPCTATPRGRLLLAVLMFKHSRAKHIDVRYHFIKEQVENGIKALDDALVAPADRLEFEKCNMRLKTDIKPKEATFQVVLDALALTQFYRDPNHYRCMFHKKKLLCATYSGKTYCFRIEFMMLRRTKRCHIPDSQRSSLIPHVKGFIYFKENQDVWHTDRDDTLFTSMRCIFRHEDTQVYGTILPTKLTNQAMLESKAYQTYYAFASGEKAPKLKYIRKKADFDTSPKKKPVQATKGTRLKSKAKVAKPDKKKRLAKKTKAKGLAVLSEVSLTEAEQIKLDTKRSKKDFHVSHASGSGDGVDTQVPDVPLYKSKSDKESWVDSEDKDNNDDDGDSDDHDDDNNDE
ncbi:retrovirus-related pol polyprotein from transposon TNT 1-94 [Tanacetum coccineum]